LNSTAGCRYEIDLTQLLKMPAAVRRKVRLELARTFPDFDLNRLDPLLKILWLNNGNHIHLTPPARPADP